MLSLSDLSDVTVLIPCHEDGNKEWLDYALRSLPASCKHMVLWNTGDVGGALNQGLRDATTEFVFPMGADDALTENCLEILRGLIWNADITYPSMVLTTEDMRVIDEYAADPFCPNRLLVWNYVPGVFLARREKLLGCGGYRDLEMLEDWDVLVRASRAGLRFKAAPEAKYVYRQVPGSRNKSSDDPITVRQRWRDRIIGADPGLAATWYAQATPVTTYWRCQLPARYVSGQATSGFPLAYENDDRLFLPDHYGPAVFQFPGDPGRQAIVEKFKRYGIRSLVEVDDNYLIDAGRITRKAGWTKSKLDEHKSLHSVERHIEICRSADGVIVSAPWLGDQYRQVNPNVFVCPNQLAPEDWPELEDPDDGVFRIGWFASMSHRSDLPLVLPALRWASEQPGVEVVLMGIGGTKQYVYDNNRIVGERTRQWKELRGLRYRYIPHSNDLSVYHKMLGVLDVGLAPVTPGRWANGRSDLKALEYAFAGACPVLSSAPPYQGWKHGNGCLKAATPQGFVDNVKVLVQNKSMARELALQAREYVLAERTMARNKWRWEEALGVSSEKVAA